MATAGRADLAAIRRIAAPPVGELRFWFVQAMVVALAGLHLFVDLETPSEQGPFPGGIPVALLVIPVGYAALAYGLAGSAGTAIWGALLWLPDLLLPHDEGHVGADLVDLALVVVVAFFFGHWIEAERAAHSRADRYAALVVAAEEDQRRRLARELHDEPLQHFLHLARRLESLARASGVPASVAAGLGEARLHAIDAATRLRGVARDLRPPALDQLGLVAALGSFLADVEEASDLEVELSVHGDTTRLAPDAELGAFRIVQEAVRNTVRHAGARHVEVTVEFAPHGLRLEVADDGRGFVRAGGELAAGHLGLLGMTERARLLGGSLDVRTAPGAGTVVEASIPRRRAPMGVGG